jgi:hypothetical protein
VFEKVFSYIADEPTAGDDSASSFFSAPQQSLEALDPQQSLD